jgi:hypothetical protein
MEHMATPETTSQEGRARSQVTRDSAGAHLNTEARSEAVGYVVALKPTYVGRCGLKLQLMWQRVDAHTTPCLDLELVCGGTWCSEYRHTHSLSLVLWMGEARNGVRV